MCTIGDVLDSNAIYNVVRKRTSVVKTRFVDEDIEIDDVTNFNTRSF
jgi:hypothetical protein